ncbi:MAG: MaoC family dehydratase [Steroidobacteraceae bacterium]|nr:MaoC family dehydratase [Steroidobacteraceae bacterium]
MRIGSEIGVSDWFVIDQRRIDSFAAVTQDHQFIHTDPDRALASPFGGTIAHGYLTLALLSAMAASGVPALQGATMGINYGFDRLRFLTPVRVDSRVRARFTLSGLSERGEGRWLMALGVVVEIEEVDQPALVADWLTLVLGEPQSCATALLQDSQ